MPDLETQLRSYSEYLDREFPAVTFEEITDGFRETSSPVRPLRLRRGLAVAIASAVVVLILVGGLAFLVSFFGEEEAPVVTTPEPAPPTTVVEPPHRDGDPDLGAELALQKDFIERLGDTLVVETSMGTWVWTLLDPQDPVLRTEEPAIPDTPQPGIDLLDELWVIPWRVTSAVLGDVTVTVVPVAIEINWNRVYQRERYVVGRFLEPFTTLRIVETSDPYAGTDPDDEVVATLTASIVPGNPDAVEFVDQETGELVLRLEASDPMIPAEQLIRAGASCWGAFGGWCGSVVWYLEVDDGGNPAWVDPPWTGLPVDEMVVAAASHGFVIVVASESAQSPPTLQNWGSADGRTWEAFPPPGPIDLAVGSEVTGLHVAGGANRLLITLEFYDPLDPYLDPKLTWMSTDRVWQPVDIDFRGADPGQFVLTGDGWLVLTVDNGCEVWLPTDEADWGSGWERIPFLTGPVPPGMGSQCHGVEDGSVIAIVEGHDGPMGFWSGGFAASGDAPEEGQP